MNQYITQWLNRYPNSTAEEMRAIRRSFINEYLDTRFQWTVTRKLFLSEITSYIRLLERVNYGQELKRYA